MTPIASPGSGADLANVSHAVSSRNTSRNHNQQSGQFSDKGTVSHRRRGNHNSPNTPFSSGKPNDATPPDNLPKPYLAAPFQSDPAIYNAAAAAAAAAQANLYNTPKQLPLENTGPTAVVPPAALPYVSQGTPITGRNPPPFYPYPMYYARAPGISTAPIAAAADNGGVFVAPTTPTDGAPPVASGWMPVAGATPAAAAAAAGPPVAALPAGVGTPPMPAGYAARPPVMPVVPPGVRGRGGGSPGVPRSPYSTSTRGAGDAPRNLRNLSDGSTVSNGSGSSAGSNSAGRFVDSGEGIASNGGIYYRGGRRDGDFRGGRGIVGNEHEAGGCTTNLYIRGLQSNATDESLYDLCKGFGNIYSSKAILDLTTQECKGFGFVMYETEAETKAAFEGLVAQGFQVSYARTDPRSPGKDSFVTRLKSLHDEQSTNIYISNLPLSMDENGLVELLKPSVVVSAKILRDTATQKSRGVGFARLETREEAQQAISMLQGKILTDSFQHLQARFADSLAQKRFKMNSQLFAGAGATAGASGMYGGPGVMAGLPPGGFHDEQAGDTAETKISPGSQSSTESPAIYYDPYGMAGAGMPTIPYVFPPNAVYYPLQSQPVYFGQQYYHPPLPIGGTQIPMFSSPVPPEEPVTSQTSPAISDVTANDNGLGAGDGVIEIAEKMGEAHL